MTTSSRPGWRCWRSLLYHWGVALNGFTYMQNRWVWAFALLEAFILARVAPRMAELTAAERGTLILLLAGYCLLTFWNTAARSEWALLGTVLLLLLAGGLAVLPTARPGTARAVLLAGCCLGIVLNIGCKYGQREGNYVSEFRAPGEAWAVCVTNDPVSILKQLPDDGFWRYDSAFNEPENAAMLLDLHGTGFFWSLHNGYLSQLFSELG